MATMEIKRKPTIAIVGASSDRSKFGNRAVRAYAARGYEVFPVNPRESVIEGHKAYASVNDVPVEELDCISIYLSPAVGLKALDDIARKPAKEVFFNPGADAPAVIARARELGLPVVVGCSIVAVGVNPHAMD
jgi:predicted CoA-binding protein